jgi:hypothetical protein
MFKKPILYNNNYKTCRGMYCIYIEFNEKSTEGLPVYQILLPISLLGRRGKLDPQGDQRVEGPGL